MTPILQPVDLSNYLKDNNYNLTVVGLPKTIDNDVFPMAQTLDLDSSRTSAIFLKILLMKTQHLIDSQLYMR